jgi:hypothetical protein
VDTDLSAIERVGRHERVDRKGRGALACLGLAVLALTLALCAAGSAQETIEVPGVALDASSRRGIEGVVLFVVGTDISAASDENGAFVLRGLGPGRWVLRARHVAYGEHEHELVVAPGADVRIEVRMAQEAIELEEVLVETESSRIQAERARGSSRNVVERPQIERALGVSRHLGDLIRQTVPGIRMRQANNLVGTDVCLEFRSATDISLLERQACNHPLLLLDGVPVSNPNFAYGTIGLNTIQRIRVMPPGEAGARYGTGSLYGVLLIETRDPRPDVGELRSGAFSGGRATFDWSLEPSGHNGWRTAGAAFLGNAVGLAAGLAVGSNCIGIDERDQIVTKCGGFANVGAGVAAFAIPAVTSAIGARLGGGTDGSVGRLGPALIGATMALLPGYVYSLSTVGRGSDTANAAGAVLLLVGTPLAVTVADKLFRNSR